MYGYHKDKKRYFDMQYLVARDHILPFIKEVIELPSGSRVLEIGCGEAGVLKAFREIGCNCLGIELMDYRTELAREFHDELDLSGAIEFINEDIYNINPETDLEEKFDLVILKDVIEHIPDQRRFIPELKKFLKPEGVVFFGFPPWYMPFGGHQQVSTKKLLSVTPYYHILPRPIYKGILKAFGEKPERIEGLMDIKDTAISIERFEKIIKRSGYAINKKQSWLLNPIYKYKFGKGPVKQASVIAGIPWVRDFVTTAVYYVVGSR
jgi:SAM-dependent methyltransferase